MSMKSLILAILLGTAVSSGASAMPPRPDLAVKLGEQGRLEEARETLLLSAADLETRRELAGLDSANILVLLVDFDDVPADTILHAEASYDRLLFDRANLYSLVNYYDWNSYGRLDVKGDIYGWFRCPEPLSYYVNERKGMGSYPRNAQRMVEDAVTAADPFVDFSRYDNDGPDGIPSSGDDDGVVDFLFVIHGGQGYEWTMNPNHIHSHVANIRAMEVDGVLVKTYATEPEDGRVGTFAHEMGHLLGLPDLYDVTLNTFGLGMWSLMAYGSWGGGDGSRPVGLDAWSRSVLGFVDPVVVDSNSAGYELPCIEDGPHVLRLWSGAEGGPQYFLVENRRAKGWDGFLSYFGEGLLVYHVDERIRDNSVEGDHLVSLEQADGNFDLEKRRLWGFGSDGGDPFPGSSGNREFTWWSVPSNYSNEGIPTEVSLRGIGDPADVAVFDVEVRSPILVFDTYSIDDRRGDGDGTPDPGEQMKVEIRLRNYGSTARDIGVHIHTDDSNIEPREAWVETPLVDAGSLSAPMQFDATLGFQIPEPYEITYDMEITAEHDYGTYSSLGRFKVSIPLRAVAGWPTSVVDMFSGAVALADIDHDGFMEVMAGCANRRLYAWKHDGSIVPGWPVYVGDVTTCKPAVCDIDVDGRPDVIVSSRDGKVYAFRNDGERLPGWPQQTGGAIQGSPVLSDIDDDGMVEVVCGSTDGKVYAWNEDGKKVKGWPVEVGGFEIWMTCSAADIDGDHVAEIIVGGYGGQLYILRGDGKALEGWPVPVGRGCGRGSPAIADFDGDGAVDIAVSGLFANSVYVVGVDGEVKAGWPVWSNNCGDLSSPVAADIDNDGLPEVTVATSCGTIVAWNADGSQCAAITGKAAYGVHGCEPLLGDLDGNATIEGIIGTSGSDQAEIDAFGENGRMLGFPLRVPGRVWSTPAMADVDNDGSVEIVVATTAGDVHMWRFVGAQAAGRLEHTQARGDIWNTGLYGFAPNANVPLADLALSSSDIRVEPASPRVGDTVRVEVTVTNAGHWGAGEFNVNLYGDIVSDTTLLGSIEVPYLGAKSSVSMDFEWKVPGGEASRLAIVMLDSRDDVLELSELNNQAGRRFYLAVADLEVAVERVDPFPVVLGDSLVVHATVKNAGDDKALAFTVEFFDSLAAESRRFATFTIDSLLPGEILSMAPRYRIDRFRGDCRSILAVVDRSNDILEYHHNNNTSRLDVNSGISGKIMTAPIFDSITNMTISRTHVAVESPQGRTVLVMEAWPPYRTVYQAMGSDIDLCRKSLVFSTGGDIVGYDIADSVMFVMSTSPADEVQPVIWGDKVAWIAQSPMRTDLMLRRSTADAETVRTKAAWGISDPDISYRLLVWQEQGEQGYDIMGYDLAGDSLITVCDDDGDQTNPSVWGNTVVWEDHSGEGGGICGVDLTTGRRLAVGGLPGLRINPEVSGDIVVWQDSRNGNWDIYGCRLKDDTEFPICRQSADQVMPQLSDSTVFWVDQRSHSDRVLGLEFGGPVLVADIRRFEALSQDGRISLLVDVDEHSDGITYRLYRYPDKRDVFDDRMAHIRCEFELGADTVYVYPDTSVASRRPFYYTLGVIDGYGDESLYGPVGGASYAPAPEVLSLGAPFPNPCRGEVSFNFGLPRRHLESPEASWSDPDDQPGAVTVGVYTVGGRLVRTLKSGRMSPGYLSFTWDGRNDSGQAVGSGVYFISARSGGEGLSHKVILLR
jgi:immune inhibitor A